MDDLRPRCQASQDFEQQKSWWDENGDAVEGRLIDLLLASEPHRVHPGTPRKMDITFTPTDEDVALVREQAKRLGVGFSEHMRRIFHDAVLAEQRRLVFRESAGNGKMGSCKAVESWPSISAKSA